MGKRFVVFVVGVAVAGTCGRVRAALVNGNFDSTPANVYFELGATDVSVTDDVPGWLIFIDSAANTGSWVYVNSTVTNPPNVRDLDIGVIGGVGGIKTADDSRPAVTPGVQYTATCTADKYNNFAGAEFFVDWFNTDGALISSSGGGDIGNPNGNTFAPYTQTFTINAVAPGGAVAAGVRFVQTAGSSFSRPDGLTVDNFTFAAVPEPSGLVLLGLAGGLAVRRRRWRGAAELEHVRSNGFAGDRESGCSAAPPGHSLG